MVLAQAGNDEFQGQASVGCHDSRRDQRNARMSRAMERRNRMGGGSAHRSMSEIGAAICGAGYGSDRNAPPIAGAEKDEARPAAGGYVASRRKMMAPPGGRSNVVIDDGKAAQPESIFGCLPSDPPAPAPSAAPEQQAPASRLSYAEELAAQIAQKKVLDGASGNNLGSRRTRRTASEAPRAPQEDAAGGMLANIGGSAASRQPSRGRSREAAPPAAAAQGGDSLTRLLAERGESVTRDASDNLAARRAAVPGLEDSPPPAAHAGAPERSNFGSSPQKADAAASMGRPPRPTGGNTNLLTGGSERQDGSSNRYANGMNQNCGNVLTDRRTSRVLKPPGGGSSFSLA